MNKQIDILRHTRHHLLHFISDLGTDELNEIPQGFNNNIAWNLGHLIATQQSICYLRAGLPLAVDERYLANYKPDTRPGEYVDEDEITTMKQLLVWEIEQLEMDHQKNAFANYTAWTNRYGVAIQNIDDVLGFLPFHEGLHLGYVMAQKRMIKNPQVI